MKMKLLLVIGLIASSLGLALLFSSGVSAAGETYKWIDANTIQASGGSYSNKIVKSVQSGTTTTTQPVQTVTFKRDGTSNTFKADTNNIFYTTSGGVVTGTGKCELQLSLTVPSDNVNSGSLKTNNSGTSCNQSGLDLTTTLADTGNATKGATTPPAGTTTPPAGTGATTGNDSTGCNIEAIGWIVCPVVRFMAKIVDGAYAFVSSLLEIQPLTATAGTADQSIYGAWTVMRNFANIAFVIAFMFIIYSQLTSFGLNNYGVKKMLPRLIVAAILVNASFWICALAVDISNILGASLNGLFKSIPIEGAEGAAFTVKDPSVTGSGWQGLVGGIIASTVIVGVVLYVTLSALVPAILAAFIAIITVFLVLSIRQALVILLIVISPLAFVAYLLPNTESLYKKWLGLFKTMLLMYPVIALLFGASALASKIVMNSATGDYALAVQIMGALISIVPLALTPIVMKTAGGVLNRIGGFINNPNKGPVDRLRKGAQSYAEEGRNLARGSRLSRASKVLDGSGKILGKSYSKRRRAAALLGSFGATSAIDNEKRKGFAKAVADESGQEYFAKRSIGEEGFAERIAGSEQKGQGLKASAQGAVDKIMQQDVANREILYTANIKIRNNPKAELEKALGANDTVGIQALGSMLMKGGAAGYGDFNETVSNYEKTSNQSDRAVQGTMNSVKKFVSDNGKDFKAKDPALLKWAKDAPGYTTLDAAVRQPSAVSGSDQEVASVAPASLEKAAQHGNISIDKARSILSNVDLAAATSEDNKKILRAVIANNQQPITGDIKTEINRLANSAPTVEQIQQATQRQATTPSTPPAPQQPGVLNIPHNSNPGNSRTSPPPNSGSATILNPNNQNNDRQ